MRNRSGVVMAGVVLAGAAALWLFAAPGGTEQVDVVVPELGPAAAAGQEVFASNCAQCHGTDAGGTDQGPPLIHKIYEPSHHGDVAFVMAAQNGVRAHHWPFGDMPAQPQVGARSVQQIIAFVREVQRANGID